MGVRAFTGLTSCRSITIAGDASTRARTRATGHLAGGMFWLPWKTFSGSYWALMRASRS
jgi:hypothetical protein